MTSLSPLLIRYTCKDTSFKDPMFGWLVRGAKCIGIKRKQDYKNQNIDNDNAFEELYSQLSNNSIIGMYPEGVGLYKPSLSPFRTGLARIAINLLLQHQHKSVYIVPVGMTYLHREKFRSSAAVRIGQPMLLNIHVIKHKIKQLSLDIDIENAKLSMSTDDIYKIGKNITNELRERVKDLVISSPDWHTLALSHLARSIIFPESSSPQKGTFLTYTIDLTRQFNIALAENQTSDT